MPATSNVRKRGALHRRRIIERPRLLALLDGSPARVRTLIAPAGYGKTTLAEQWVGQQGRRHAWFTARSASTDVAALALGVARAATAIVPDCDVRLREHLRALPAPAEHVDVLAELLGEDLAGWPEDAWLVFDDYHELAPTLEAETFVEELVVASPIQLLIASRQRPAWITARRILYGEVLELNQTELAMDGHEAAEVLTERNAASASGLVALANGWPAVIGLASVSTAEIEEPGAVPEALYEFFAEEVFSSLPDEVQAGLTTLAIAPVMDRALAMKLLGDSCDRICSAALRVGILVARGAQLEIHPLARAFLGGRLENVSGAADPLGVQRCLTYFRERRDWDAAFDLIARHGQLSELESLLEEALDELLEMARLSTIESWCLHAQQVGADRCSFLLARAEVALRRGHLAEAQSCAETSAAEVPTTRFRAFLTAARAAHLASLDLEALELFRRAESAARTNASRRDARWGQVVCMTDLEMPEMVSLLEELNSGVGLHDPRDALRAAAQRMAAETRLGRVVLADGDRAAQLLSSVSDPLVTSGFLSAYSSDLGQAARYDDARQAATALLKITNEFRLDFALPYALCTLGVAEAGLRNWDAADIALRRGVDEARNVQNAHGEQGCLAAQFRASAQRGRFDSALELEYEYEHSLRPSGPVPVSMYAEFAGTKALIRAAMGRLEEAMDTVDQIRGISRSVEAVVLTSAVDAVVSFKRHQPDAIERVSELADKAFASGALDLLLTTYRAVPEMLVILFRTPSADALRELIRRVGDDDIAHSLGCSMSSELDAVALLTPRQHEVYELLREGLTNREIARLLVIEETTAKLHVQHVFDKLGVRSRRTIAMRAALERSTQATSAIDDTGAGTGS